MTMFPFSKKKHVGNSGQLKIARTASLNLSQKLSLASMHKWHSRISSAHPKLNGFRGLNDKHGKIDGALWDALPFYKSDQVCL